MALSQKTWEKHSSPTTPLRGRRGSNGFYTFVLRFVFCFKILANPYYSVSWCRTYNLNSNTCMAKQQYKKTLTNKDY